MIKTKKQMYIVVALFALILLLGTTTYAFFNYTRTGVANRIQVGRIAFETNQETTISFQNAFPISSEEAETDTTNAKTLAITVTGDTDYTGGLEYVVTASDVNLTVGSGANEKTLPIAIEVEVTNNGTGSLGTVETGDYYANRNSYTVSKYKVEYDGTLEENSHILVGYIAPNTTAGTIEGINGIINIKAYIDDDKILISDTYNNGNTPTDNLGTPVSLGEDKTVFTTTEWNSITGQNALSFKIKVEAREGIWVEEPLTALGVIAKNVITPTRPINFGSSSSEINNGKGLYILPGTQGDAHPIYYYRGAIDNNNVLFGGFCWQIVRTTETGGIKMIYNGLPDIEGTGDNITYNCGVTRDIQDTILSTTSLQESTGYYYADDYEIVSTSGNSATYKLKSKTNPITQVAINDDAAAASNIPTIAANYPYTCKQTTETGTCTTLYKVDSYASSRNANVYSSLDRTIIGRSTFNTNYQNIADVGYMSNTRYEYGTFGWTTGALFASDATWVSDHYELVDASVTTPDTTHHYSCNQASADATCTSLRYVYYSVSETWNYYITLTNGELIEDALYKMTGNGSAETKAKNASYVLNQNDSIVKTVIDNWFRTNLTNEVNTTSPDYRAYLEDTVFCNDRSYKETGSINTYNQSGWNRDGGSSRFLYFGTWNRFRNDWYSTINVPSMTCPNETDRFSVASSVAHLNYPVGLLTADEIILAGVGGNTYGTTTYYLYTNDYYWTLSPSSFYDSFSYVLNAGNDGNLIYSGGSGICGLRPVVSLKPGTEFESGGDGTATSPYVVKIS